MTNLRLDEEQLNALYRDYKESKVITCTPSTQIEEVRVVIPQRFNGEAGHVFVKYKGRTNKNGDVIDGSLYAALQVPAHDIQALREAMCSMSVSNTQWIKKNIFKEDPGVRWGTVSF